MKIRVSVRPHVYQGIVGYRVRWQDGNKLRTYFVGQRAHADVIKARIKAGKTPVTGRYWAVKI